MRNIFKKGLFIAIACLVAIAVSAETMYVVSGKCNVPLKAGMNSASHQIFSWDGTNAAVTTAVTSSLTGTAGCYYNSTSLTLSNLKNMSNYGTSSTSNRTMQAIKVQNNEELVINFAGKTMSKIIVVGRAASNESLSIDILGETKNTNNKNFFYVEKEQTFTNSISINNTTGKEFSFFVYMIEGAPVPTVNVSSVSLNKTSTSIEAGYTETLTATVLPNNASDKSVTWSSSAPSIASVDENGVVTANAVGTAVITVTTTDGSKTATCNVTVTPNLTPIAVTGVSLDKSQLPLVVGASATLTATVAPATANNKAVTWQSSAPTIASVNNGVVSALAVGNATITVTTTDGGKTATCAVTVSAATPVPQTSLSLHEPELYEKSALAGGYGQELVVHDSREYEVFYLSNNSGDFITAGSPKYDMDKSGTAGYVVGQGSSGSVDGGWVKTVSSSSYTSKAALAIDEFQCANSNYLGLTTTSYIELHIKGYDQFSMIANDKSAVQIDSKTGLDKKAGEHLKILIDGEAYPRAASDMKTTDPSLFRFDITTGEHVIKIMGTGSTANRFRAFSLRVAQEPRAKYLEGNDSTQLVYQTQDINPIQYYTKYNSQGETRLEWVGATATGISLTTTGSDELGDSLAISGKAQCPVGSYNYKVVSYKNNVPTNTLTGSFRVGTLLKPTSPDTVFEAYAGEPMDQIEFKYYALSADGISLTWKGNTPSGVTGAGASGNKYVIRGTPSQPDTYNFTVSIEGGNSLNGQLKVIQQNIGANPVLYLYKNTGAYEKDGVYEYLTSGSTKIANLVPRKALTEGTRSNYSTYNWILISPDVDATNQEVIDIIKNNKANNPVLNMQGFVYGTGRLDWGEPYNGSLDTTTHNGCNIFVNRPEHPIFKNVNYNTTTGQLQVLKNADKKGLMPIDINKCEGSLCLATAYTRNIENYNEDGELQTIIHEVPLAKRGGKKYISFPVANTRNNTNGQTNLTDAGKQLLRNIVSYLTDNSQSSVALPTLRMTSFVVHGYTAVIDESKKEILLTLTYDEYVQADSLQEEKPIITLADDKTHVIFPDAKETVDLRFANFFPKTFVVTDYINRVPYSFKLKINRPEGIEDVYTSGQWVNIFDIYGRKITTTNEDIYTMELPHGIYLVVTENGGTIKIMK